MKNFLLAFFVFFLYSLFGMWYHACIIKEVCKDSTLKLEEVVNEDRKDMESRLDDSKSSSNMDENEDVSKPLKNNESFSFPKNISLKANESTVVFPNGQDAFAESIYNFLNANQNKELLITGLFNSDEANFNNQLGVNRANFIKALLVKYGINENRVTTNSKKSNFKFDSNSLYTRGIEFSFGDLSEEKLKVIETGIENKTLYSGFGSKQFRADNTLEAYAIELKNYFEKYPNKLANIIGHTDSVGDTLANDWYGMERAKNVKQYLVSQGILETKLFVSSKGELEPIASNGTLEGRRKNRRIEIKIN